MELDDLKSAWKKQFERPVMESASHEELRAMLKIKATNTIELLKKNVLFELWSTLVFIVVCIATVFFSSESSIQLISSIAAFISTGFVFYYYNKLLLITKLNIGNKSLKEHLTYLIIQFEKFLWFYRWGYNYLIPLCLIAGGIFGVYASDPQTFITSITSLKIWLILIGATFPLAIMFNYGMKWYLNELYGNHLSKLRLLLKDLEE